jgi:hypothetical protein
LASRSSTDTTLSGCWSRSRSRITPRWARGRVGAGVAEAEVAGDKRPVIGDRGGEHVGVGAAGQILVGDGVDLVAASNERVLGRDGDVLVEFEPHVLGVSGRISCLASHAP